MNRILRSTDIRGALKARQKGFILNPYSVEPAGGGGSTPVDFVGASSAANGITTFGGITVLENDLIYYVLINQASATIPSLPAGYTSIYAQSDAVPAASGTHSIREVWKIAGSSEVAPGTVTNCNRWLLAIFRNTNTSNPFGAVGFTELGISSSGGGVTTFAFPALSFNVENNTSQVACMLYAPAIGTNNGVDLNALPSDLTERRRISGTNSLYGIGTSGPQSSYGGSATGSSIDRPVSGTYYLWLRSREILGA